PLPDDFRIDPVKALVPLLPLALLFLVSPSPWQVIEVPRDWLVGKDGGVYESRLIATAMLVGLVAASLTAPAKAWEVARVFFEGTGYAFTHIVSLIIVAMAFGEGIKVSGVGALLARGIGLAPALLWPSAATLTVGFGWVSGSGMATTQALFG